MEKLIKIYKSFEEADKADIKYWRNASYKTRIETLLSLQKFILQFSYPNARKIERIITSRKFGE